MWWKAALVWDCNEELWCCEVVCDEELRFCEMWECGEKLCLCEIAVKSCDSVRLFAMRSWNYVRCEIVVKSCACVRLQWRVVMLWGCLRWGAETMWDVRLWWKAVIVWDCLRWGVVPCGILVWPEPVFSWIFIYVCLVLSAKGSFSNIRVFIRPALAQPNHMALATRCSLNISSVVHIRRHSKMAP